MSYLLRSNRVQIAAVVVLCALLLTLALFQYSSLGQLSELEKERMRSNLQFATRAVRWDFDSELADLYRTFQVDYRQEESFPEQLAAHYAERVETVEGPDILDRFYWVTLDEGTGLTIEEFTGAGFAMLAQWPHELATLEKGFENQLDHSESQFDLLVGPPPLQPDIPALIIQQVFARPRGSVLEHQTVNWVIAKLARAKVVDELIPALSDQYIFGQEELDYNVGVVDIGDPGKLIYASRPGLTAQSFAEPDAARDIFALRIWHLNQRNAIERRVWNVVRENAEPKWTLVVKHHAGSLEAAVAAARNRSLAVSLSVLALLGAAIAMIVVSTRRAQRLAAQQMEFVAGVSHELRTPLTVIRTAAENLADDIVHDPDRTRQYGDLINREGRRLSDMVERVLLFAKMRSGNLQLQQENIDVVAAIDDAIAANSTWLEERSVTVNKEVPESLPEIIGDRPALSSVIQNLVSNAIKYSRRGGIVTIQARAVRAGPGSALQIAIHDQGDGIPGNEIPHLFEPFFRGRRARAAQIQGSGLGLSLVKQVVEAHGGSIDVVSTPGAGSTFLVQLPLP